MSRSQRERREDIPLLARHFLERLSHEMGKEIGGISEGALKILMDYNWSGSACMIRMPEQSRRGVSGAACPNKR